MGIIQQVMSCACYCLVTICKRTMCGHAAFMTVRFQLHHLLLCFQRRSTQHHYPCGAILSSKKRNSDNCENAIKKIIILKNNVSVLNK